MGTPYEADMPLLRPPRHPAPTIRPCDPELLNRVLELAGGDADEQFPLRTRGGTGNAAHVVAGRLGVSMAEAANAIHFLAATGDLRASWDVNEAHVAQIWTRRWVEPPSQSPVASSPPRRRMSIRNVDRKFVLERDGYQCVLCGATDDLTLDHILPQSRGGSGRPINLRVLCRSCNSSKGDRIPDSIRLVK